YRERQIYGADHNLCSHDRRDDDEEQLADENIKKETCCQRGRTSHFLNEVDRREPPKRFEDVQKIPWALLANRYKLDHDENHERVSCGGVQIGCRRSAEWQAENFEREHAELIEQE